MITPLPFVARYKLMNEKYVGILPAWKIHTHASQAELYQILVLVIRKAAIFGEISVLSTVLIHMLYETHSIIFITVALAAFSVLRVCWYVPQLCVKHIRTTESVKIGQIWWKNQAGRFITLLLGIVQNVKSHVNIRFNFLYHVTQRY